MKDFARGSGRLRQLPLLARLTYTIFIAFTLIALGFSAWLGAEMLAPDLSRFDEYYAGIPAEPSAPAPSTTGGPQIELPAEAPATPEPISVRKLLEVTHFHLFSIPVYLMILSHLFMLSGWSTRTKLGWITLATVSVAAHLAAPWVARSAGAFARAFYAGSGMLLGVTFTVMSAVPLFDMWRPRRGIPKK